MDKHIVAMRYAFTAHPQVLRNKAVAINFNNHYILPRSSPSPKPTLGNGYIFVINKLRLTRASRVALEVTRGLYQRDEGGKTVGVLMG